MIDLDSDSVARALNLQHFIDSDTRDPANSILLSQLARARASAIEAVRALIEVDATDTRAVLALQGDVRRFTDLVEWIADSQTAARDAFALLPTDEQQEVLTFIANPHQQVNDA